MSCRRGLVAELAALLESRQVAPCLAQEQEAPAHGLAQPGLPSSARRKAPKRQQPGLAPVQRQRKPLKPLAHRLPECGRFSFVLKPGHAIVGLPHHDHRALGFSPSPLLGPEVKNVVQQDVRQQR